MNVYRDGYLADKVLQRVLKDYPRTARMARGIVVHAVYGMLRHQRLLMAAVGCENEMPDSGEQDLILQAYLKWFGTYDGRYHWSVRADWKALEEQRNLLMQQRVYRYNIPDWVDHYGFQVWGPQWEPILQAMQKEAHQVLRINPLKSSREEVFQLLKKNDIPAYRDPRVESGLHIVDWAPLWDLTAFKQGLFEIQDAGSQQVGEFCAVQPGMRVIDACAGSGGKTLQLAGMMQNKGKIIALDTDAVKLDALSKRARRAGVHNIETRVIDSTKVIKKLRDWADVVLVDAPCSGSGVWRRNPDAKYRLEEEDLDQLVQTQRDLLVSYQRMVKPGGILIYATCSIFPRENEEQMQWFEEEFGGMERMDQQFISPADGDHDGFYMVKWNKKS
ncbi:MAG: RsmB/NOP family class I SAM-dependent RNA methyltransferase [Saprospiraceae bacterium]